jgi:hypothetical protein
MSLRVIWQYMDRSVTKKILASVHIIFFLVTDRSIYCHITLSAMNYLLYSYTLHQRLRSDWVIFLCTIEYTDNNRVVYLGIVIAFLFWCVISIENNWRYKLMILYMYAHHGPFNDVIYYYYYNWIDMKLKNKIKKGYINWSRPKPGNLNTWTT